MIRLCPREFRRRRGRVVPSLHSLAKDSVIYGGADLVSKFIAFFLFPIIAAALSPLAFGALELIATTTSLLGLVMNCGLNNSVHRYYWDIDTVPAQRPVIVSSGLAAQLLFGGVALLFALLALPTVLPEVRRANFPLSWIALVAALFLMVFVQWQGYLLDVLRLHFAPWKFLTLSLISRVLGSVLSVLAVVFWHWGVDGLLGVQAAVSLAVLPLAAWMVRKDLTSAIDRVWFRKLVGFGYPFIFAGLAYWLFGSIDRWMLASMSSVKEVGIYSVAFRFVSVVFFVSAAFGQAWSPVAIKIRTDNPDGYRVVYAQVLLLLLFVMLLVGGGISLFSGELIGLIMPSEYASSAPSLAVLCFGIVLQSTQQVTAVGISLEKKTFIFARLAWFTALFNLGLNWILIPRYGAVGAAWATTASYLMLTGSYLYYTQQLHPLPIPWGRLLWLLLLGSLIGVVAVLMNQPSFSWALVGLKLLLATVCVGLGLLVLPIRRLDFAR